MFRADFSIVHRGCLVNRLSRRLPRIRFICPGGFLEPASVEELIILDNPSDDDVGAVTGFLKAATGVTQADLLERTSDKAFVRFVSTARPETFCSQVVARHHGFRIGMEIQKDGLEMWRVGCVERRQAEEMIEELKALGELKHSAISEASWQELLEGGTT